MQKTGSRYRADQACGEADENHRETLTQDQANYFLCSGAKGHADADFGDALAGEIREHAVDADAREQECEAGENSEQQEQEALTVERGCDQLVHRGFVVERLIAAAAELLAERLDHRRRIAFGADGERHYRGEKTHEVIGNLSEWVVDLIVDARLIVAGEAPMA